MLIEFSRDERILLLEAVREKMGIIVTSLNEILDLMNDPRRREMILTANLPEELKRKLLLTEEAYRENKPFISEKDISSTTLFSLYSSSSKQFRIVEKRVLFESIYLGIIGEYLSMDGHSYFIVKPTEEEVEELLDKDVIVIQPLEVVRRKENHEIVFITGDDKMIVFLPDGFFIEKKDRNVMVKIKVYGRFNPWYNDVYEAEIERVIVSLGSDEYEVVLHGVSSPRFMDRDHLEAFLQLPSLGVIYSSDIFLRLMGFRREKSRLSYKLDIGSDVSIRVIPSIRSSDVVIDDIEVSGKNKELVNLVKTHLRRYIPPFMLVPTIISVLDIIHSYLREKGVITGETEKEINELSILKMIAFPPLSAYPYGKIYRSIVYINHGNPLVDILSSKEAAKKIIKYFYRRYNVNMFAQLVRLSEILNVKNNKVIVLGYDIDDLEKKYRRYIKKEIDYPLLDIGLHNLTLQYFDQALFLTGIKEFTVSPQYLELKDLLTVFSVEEALTLARRGLISIEDLKVDPTVIPVKDLVKVVIMTIMKDPSFNKEELNSKIKTALMRYYNSRDCNAHEETCKILARLLGKDSYTANKTYQTLKWKNKVRN